MSQEQMVFDDLQLREVPVKIGQKEYTLREANGEAARKFRNAVIKAARFGPDGKAERLEGAADAELVLINACLVDASGRQTPINVLAGWPNRVLKALFNRAKEISDLGESDDSERGLLESQKRLSKELEEVASKLQRFRTAEDNGQETDPTAPPLPGTTAGSG
jgi:hypothetical protein